MARTNDNTINLTISISPFTLAVLSHIFGKDGASAEVAAKLKAATAAINTSTDGLEKAVKAINQPT